MATLFERIRDVAHFTRTPSLTDTDDSAPSDDLVEPPTITVPLETVAPVPTTAMKRHPLLRSPSKATAASTETATKMTHVRTPSRSSTLLMMFQRPLIVALSQVSVLACLLRHLTWHEFRSLVMTSRAVRDTLDAEDCIEVILARFVPGYRLGARPSEQIPVTVEHLEAFMLSQAMSLHLYPTHALGVVDSLLNAMHLTSQTTEKFENLTIAHSRIVLLLRSRALAAPHPPEIDDQPPTPPSGGPQLVFPAPLFCTLSSAAPTRTPSKNTSRSSTLTKHSEPAPSRRGSISSLFSLPRSLSRSSKKRPLPPPVHQTHRSSISISLNKRSSQYISGPIAPPPRSRSTPPQTSKEDEIFALKPPRPWYRRHSSLPGSPASSSRGSLAAVSEKAARETSGATLLPSGPHDLAYATVPGRAPVLRVFVPTDVLSHEAIRACELLLFRSGLWDWMKPGDIVCNLGFVPREETTSAPGSPVDQFGRLGGGGNDTRQSKWLVFTGTGLVPYFPPAPPPPDIDILSIPGPAYYSHIHVPGPTQLRLPGLSEESQPKLAVGGLVYALSIPKRSGEPTMKLDSSVGYVKSARGVVRVWRPVWIASFTVDKLHPTPARNSKGKNRAWERRNNEVADEWTGEWILEGMGTREGERQLLNAIDDGHVRFWEWVREKSGPGRVWLRLVDAPALGVTEVIPPVPPVPAHLLSAATPARGPTPAPVLTPARGPTPAPALTPARGPTPAPSLPMTALSASTPTLASFAPIAVPADVPFSESPPGTPTSA